MYEIRRTALSPVAEPRATFLKSLQNCPQAAHCGLRVADLPMSAAKITTETREPEEGQPAVPGALVVTRGEEANATLYACGHCGLFAIDYGSPAA